MSDDTSPLLQRALLANAAFSGVTGLAGVVAAPPLAVWLGLNDSPDLLRALGVGLLLFAAALFRLARTDRPDPRWAVAASVADALWVVGSVGLLLLAPGLLSAVGQWALGLIAVAVAAFAIAQAAGLRRMA